MNHWRIVLLLMGLAALGHLNRVGISVTGSEVFIPERGISEVRMGWVYTAFLLTYTIGMLPGGWLIDRIGAVRTMTLYAIAMGSCVALTGLVGLMSTTATWLWVGLLVVRAVAGLTSVPLHPGAAHVVADYVPRPLRTTANGIVTAGALVGVAFSYPIYGWMNDQFGWPAAFALGGCALIFFGILWRWSTQSLRQQPSIAAIPSAQSDLRSPPLKSASLRSLLASRNLWLIAISYAAYGYFQYLFFYWMGYYFKEVLHVPEVEARWISFGIMLSQGLGMIVGGYWTDAICRGLGLMPGRRVIVITGMGLGALFGLAGVNGTGLTYVSVCLALAMASQGLCEGVFWTTATDISRGSRGFSAAFMNTGGNLGGLISPVLTPLIADSLGWSGAIGVACGVAALGGLLWLAIRDP